MGSIRGKTAVVGVGEVPTGMYPERSFIDAAVSASEMAIKDAGIRKEDIDTVIPIVVVSNALDNANMICSWMVEELGLGRTAKSNFQVASGGSSSANALKTAAALVNAGLSKAVLVVHSDRLGTGLDLGMAITMFAKVSTSQEYEMPYGFSQLALAGLLQQRYMHDTGTTERQIAAVVETNRKWAALNPNSIFYKKPITIEKVLESPVISSPVRARTMNKLCDGASAFIVTSAERARDLTGQPAYILGLSSRCTHFTVTQQPDIFKAWSPAVDEAYEMAGIGPGNVDVAELYDAFPTFTLISTELTQLCGRGEAGKFFEEGHAAPGGKLPIQTNGAMMGQGHTGAGGGPALLVEAVRQIAGKAGERQVDNVRHVIVTGSGGVGMDFHMEVLGKEV
ncbi:MAG: thiolase family protein [Deltaproteobacteria bacterium]|nr:thiolase family protein [Deltaproteobacteria bacterium]